MFMPVLSYRMLIVLNCVLISAVTMLLVNRLTTVPIIRCASWRQNTFYIYLQFLLPRVSLVLIILVSIIFYIHLQFMFPQVSLVHNILVSIIFYKYFQFLLPWVSLVHIILVSIIFYIHLQFLWPEGSLVHIILVSKIILQIIPVLVASSLTCSHHSSK